MEISFIHSAICGLDLGISCLNCNIFIFSILDLISKHPVRVSGRTIFTIVKNITDTSTWVLKLYADLKYLNLCL